MENKKPQNILVGVDLSDYSKVVVKEAQKMANRLKADLTYVYVFPETSLFTESFALERSRVTEFYEKEIQTLYRLPKNSPIVVRFGRAHEQIISAARKFKEPMIVVGHKGHNALGEFFLGSTAERLAVSSPFPVWIHKGSKVGLPKKILYPTDLSAHSKDSLKDLSSLQKSWKAKVQVYHVAHEPLPILDYKTYANTYMSFKELDDQQLRKFKKDYPDLKTDTALGSVASKINDFSKSYDVIAVTPRPKKNRSTFFGGTTESLLRAGNKPLLILP